MKKIIIMLFVLLLLCACSNKTTDTFWDSSAIEDVPVIQPVTEEQMEQNRQSVNIILGEKFFSQNYDKDKITIPQVSAEETVEGELWFPPINNSAPLDEIAPTISYELMCDGLYISSFYPDAPENYTAQALNENAFPIGFFRKINELYYYTVCKVEGGGYMYYFFMANSGITIEKASEVYDDMLSYDQWGNMIIEKPYHLFNSNLADLNGRDLTKEVIWRGSIYSAQAIPSVAEFAQKINSIGNGDDNFDRSMKYYIDADPNFNILSEIMPALYYNMANGTDAYFSVIQSTYTELMPLCQSAPRMLLLGADGFIVVNLAPSMKNGLYETKNISDLSNADILEYVQVNSVYPYTADKGLWNKVFNYGDSSYNWYVSEDNSILIEILPQDYMW